MKARSPELVEIAVAAWIDKKFRSKAKKVARESAWPGLNWKSVFVHAVVREPFELELMSRHSVQVIPLHQVLLELGHGVSTGIRGGAGTDLSEVIEYFYDNNK